MSAFEFFFSLFGLILGLAIAVVIGGLSDVLRERKRVPIGWLTPMLALFVLADLSSLWVNAWTGLSDMRVAYGPFLSAIFVAGIYFFSASMVFPKTATDWPSLDDYYMKHRRLVLGGMVLANLGLSIIGAVANNSWQPIIGAFAGSEVTLLWWLLVAVLMIFPQRRVQLAGLAALLLITAYAIVMFWNPR
jgi:hypothetical protein